MDNGQSPNNPQVPDGTVFHTFHMKVSEQNKVLNLIHDVSLISSTRFLPLAKYAVSIELNVQNPGQEFGSSSPKDWEIQCCQLSWCFHSAGLMISFVRC
jgi:hypothetical protein